jgi:hypothetical protein
MLPKNEIAKVYDTVLSIPGMNENVKLNLQTSRKNLLLLSKVIERGLNGEKTDDKSIAILEIIPKEILQELSQIAGELLSKAGLTEMNDKLKTF